MAWGEAALEQVQQSPKRGVRDPKLPHLRLALERNGCLDEGDVPRHLRSSPKRRLEPFRFGSALKREAQQVKRAGDQNTLQNTLNTWGQSEDGAVIGDLARSNV